MRKKKLHLNLLLLGVVCLLMGCGGFGVQSGKNGGAVSDSSVSVGGISGETAPEEEETVAEEKFLYSNDDNFYYVEEDENELYQYKLDGTKVDMSIPRDVEKRMLEDFFDLLWVDNEWIYYSFDHESEDEDGNYVCEFWRVPIEKQKDGDHLLWNRKEKLWSKKNFWIGNVYVENDTVVYRGVEEIEDIELTNYYKLDLAAKEEIPLWKQGKSTTFLNCLSDSDMISSAGQGGLLLEERTDESEKIALHYLDIQKWESNTIYNFSEDHEREWLSESVVSNGDSFFFCSETNDVWSYRKGEEEAHCFIQLREIEKTIDKFLSVEEECDYWVSGIFPNKERIYLQIGFQWSQEEVAQKGVLEDSEANVSHKGYLMLSCGMEEAADLKYETGITQCMEEQCQTCGAAGKQKWNEWSGQIWYYTEHSFPWDIKSGENLYMRIYDPAKDTDEDISKETWICYNIETGRSKVLDKEDEEALRLFYMGYAVSDLL